MTQRRELSLYKNQHDRELAYIIGAWGGLSAFTKIRIRLYIMGHYARIAFARIRLAHSVLIAALILYVTMGRHDIVKGAVLSLLFYYVCLIVELLRKITSVDNLHKQRRLR